MEFGPFRSIQISCRDAHLQVFLEFRPKAKLHVQPHGCAAEGDKHFYLAKQGDSREGDNEPGSLVPLS
jgi:hypothetical protein